CVDRQLRVDGLGERFAVEVGAFAQLDRRHSGAAAGTRNLDTEDSALLDGLVGPQCPLHLRGGDVFTLPPEGVAEPVDEGGMTHALRAHHVTGVEPAVPVTECVAYQLLFTRARIG